MIQTKEHNIKLIAHGCGPTIHPGATIASAKEALRQGADLVELDIQLSADKQLLVSHDRNLLRLFGADLNCPEISAAEFLSLRCKNRPEYPSHLLEHFIVSDIKPLLVHIYAGYEGIPILMDLLEQYGVFADTVFGIADMKMFDIIRSRDSSAKILAFATPEVAVELGKAGADYLRLWERNLTEENINTFRETGAELWVMSGGPDTGCPTGRPGEENLRRILDIKPDGILVNDLPFARSVIEKVLAG